MIILLQKKTNGTFIQSEGGTWTADQGRAHTFANSLEAVMFCLDRHLEDMQIVAAYSNPMFNFTVPVTNVRGD